MGAARRARWMEWSGQCVLTPSHWHWHTVPHAISSPSRFEPLLIQFQHSHDEYIDIHADYKLYVCTYAGLLQWLMFKTLRALRRRPAHSRLAKTVSTLACGLWWRVRIIALLSIVSIYFVNVCVLVIILRISKVFVNNATIAVRLVLGKLFNFE